MILKILIAIPILAMALLSFVVALVVSVVVTGIIYAFIPNRGMRWI